MGSRPSRDMWRELIRLFAYYRVGIWSCGDFDVENRGLAGRVGVSFFMELRC